MSRFEEKHYVPAIRWRQGEYAALQELRGDQKAWITPLVDIAPISWDFAAEQPAKSIDAHLQGIASQMQRAWGTEDEIFVDLRLIDPGERMTGGAHPVDHLFADFRNEEINAIPVIGFDRDAAYQASVRNVAATDQRGVALRITIDDTALGPIPELVVHLLEALNVAPDDADIIIDLRAIEASQALLLRSWATGLINGWANVNAFASLTLLSGAFPINLSAFAPGTHLIERADWNLWGQVRASNPVRKPSFGDYTAAHPDPSEIDPRIMQVSASIRYASDDYWVIQRGRSVQSPHYGQYGQYQTLSAGLLAHPLFTGHSFSWASDFITQCAGGGPTGNLTSWRKVATNRHLAYTAIQISNLP